MGTESGSADQTPYCIPGRCDEARLLTVESASLLPITTVHELM